jgi:ATP-GRASP peptide maturase of grasp-with-spasm system
MILIISDNDDLTTCEVTDWLSYYGQNFYVITPTTPIKINRIDEEDILFQICSTSFHFSQIKSYWYRRGDLKYQKNNIIDQNISPDFKNIYHQFIKDEQLTLLYYLKYRLSFLPHINSFDNSLINKLNALDVARQVGLKTPKMLITDNKKELLFFLKECESIITKTITPCILALSDQYIISAYTERLGLKDILKYENYFFPSFFQEEINKEIELRIFMLKDKFYSMAIFSQLDEQTSIDYRCYNKDNPNRNVPFIVPKELEDKLTMFAKVINLDCGSFDILINKKGEYFFLEVNPIGQLGMVSHSCNYNIEKEIALYLINGK